MVEIFKRPPKLSIKEILLDDLTLGKEMEIFIEQKCLLKLSARSNKQEMWVLKSKSEINGLTVDSISAVAGRLMERGEVKIIPITGYKGSSLGVVIMVSKETEDK